MFENVCGSHNCDGDNFYGDTCEEIGIHEHVNITSSHLDVAY